MHSIKAWSQPTQLLHVFFEKLFVKYVPTRIQIYNFRLWSLVLWPSGYGRVLHSLQQSLLTINMVVNGFAVAQTQKGCKADEAVKANALLQNRLRQKKQAAAGFTHGDRY